MMKGEHKSPEILALNPVGQLPLITVGGRPMFESAAILRYLAQAHDSLKKFYPDNLETRQMTDAALDFNGTVMRPMFIAQIRPRFIKMMTKADSLSDQAMAEIAAGEAQMPMVLGMMEKALELRDSKYVAGNEITIGDFQLFCEFKDMDYLGHSWKEFPRLSAWHDACRQEFGLKEVHDQWEVQALPFLQPILSAKK